MKLTQAYLRQIIKEEVNLILNEQEEGPQAAQKRLVTWATAARKLTPPYGKFFQDLYKVIADVQARGSSAQKDVVNDQFYKAIVLLLRKASKKQVTPQEAMKFENMMTSDIDFNLERYGYPVTAKMAGASL